MSYKSILVHVDHSLLADKCMHAAIGLAMQQEAHLIGSAMLGISRFAQVDQGTVFEHEIRILVECANQALEAFEEKCRQAGLPSYEKRLIHDDAAAGLATQACYSDLVVTGQAAPHAVRLKADVAEYVMLHSPRPVLVIPQAGDAALDGGVVVAWNGSPEATRAVTYALPLLQRAPNVTVALFRATEQDSTDGEEPGADLALWLSRHGVRVDLMQPDATRHVDDALLMLAMQRRAGLIVMGGYSHARVTEVLLGGVTLNLMQKSTIPLLIAH